MRKSISAETIKLVTISAFGAVLLSGCSGEPEESEPEALTINGAVFTVINDALAYGEMAGADDANSPLVDGGPCIAAAGYDDISEGVQVTIRDSKGEIVGVGALSGGIQTGSEGYTNADSVFFDLPICAFSFSIEAPAGLGFYSVSVGNENRGEVTFEESELLDEIKIEIGG